MPDRPKLPTVNLDALAQLFDRALDTPLAKIAGELAPEAMSKVREVRANLPDVVAGVQVRALEHAAKEVVGLIREKETAERRAAEAIGSFLDNVLTAAGARTPPARRLPAKGKSGKRKARK